MVAASCVEDVGRKTETLRKQLNTSSSEVCLPSRVSSLLIIHEDNSVFSLPISNVPSVSNTTADLPQPLLPAVSGIDGRTHDDII